MRVRPILVLDANVFIAALKKNEKYSEKCVDILSSIPGNFLLAEPSIIYQEVCGTLARRVGLAVADEAKAILDKIIEPSFLIECSKDFCISAYMLCYDYNIYSIDALYLKVALDMNGILVSLDKEDFIDRVKNKMPPIEVYHVTEFSYIK